jgi:murein DD-endopeptidase MepM/ murein hydrolase activator NlpD
VSSSTVSRSSLHGRLFFNYKGDGTQGSEDPAASNVTVRLLDTNNNNNTVAEAVSDSSGDYKLQDVKSGSYKLYCYTNRKFQYMCRDKTDVRPVNMGYDVSLAGQDEEMNIGLMEGILTLPMSHDTNFTVDRMYDHNGGTDFSGEIIWWNGPHKCASNDTYCYHQPPGTRYHNGIDYAGPEGTPIRAAAPGTIFRTQGANGRPALGGGAFMVVIHHPIAFKGYAISTGYGHLDEIKVTEGQQVERGQVIGLEGQSGTFYPHLHFSLYSPTKASKDFFGAFDPYKPIVKVPDGYWLDDADFLKGKMLSDWVPEHVPIMDENWWTVFNSPQFCV